MEHASGATTPAASRSRSRERDGGGDSAAASTAASPGGGDTLDMVRVLTQKLERKLVSRVENVAHTVSELRGEVTTTFGELLGEYDERLQRRFAGLDSRLDACCTQGRAHEQMLAGHADRIAEIEHALALTRVQTQPVPAQIDTEWERAPMLHVVRLNTADMVARAAVEEIVVGWFDEVGIKRDEWELGASAQSLGKNYSVTRARRSQRRGGRTKRWRRCGGRTAAGRST